MIKGTDSEGSWIKGPITSINLNFGHLYIEGEQIGLRDIPKHTKNNLRVGQRVIVYFNAVNRFYAKSIKELEPMEVKKSKNPEEYVTLIKEMEPFVGQEIINSLDEGERSDLLGMLNESMRNAVEIYGISATYEDTKKDTSDISLGIIESAVALTIVLDCNTKQILKKHLPADKPEK